MTGYDHEVDWLIVNELKLKGSLTCTELCESFKSYGRKARYLDILLRSSSSIKKSSRQRQSHSYKRFMQKALDWYISSFGQRQSNRLYAITRVVQMKCRLDEDTFERLDKKASYDALEHGLSGEDKYNRLYDMMVKESTPPVAESTRLSQRRRRGAEEILTKEIQRIEEQIKVYDKAILTTYNCRVLCDKYEEKDEDNRRWLNKYYDFVRNIPQGYSHLRSILVDVVYPKFLRKEHKDNTELTKYVNSLPAPPTAINNKTTTTSN